jgi:hypothetical protein
LRRRPRAAKTFRSIGIERKKEKKKLTGTSPHNPTDWTISLLAVHTQIKKETAISSALASQKLKNWNSIEGDD